MKDLISRLKAVLITFFKKEAVIRATTGKFNSVVTVNGKRTFIPAHSTFHYGAGITSDKASWPAA